MDTEEKPIVHMDHRLYHDEPRVELDVYDLGEIPKKVKLSVHRMKGFDDVLQEFRRPPSRWLNHWAKLDYGDPVPVLFDTDGQPYIMAPAKHQDTARLLEAIIADLRDTKPIIVKIYIHEKEFEEIIDRLKTAKDFCDYCGHPLPKSTYSWLEYSEGGGTIADVYGCRSCEGESIRWDTKFLRDHPILEGLDLKTR